MPTVKWLGLTILLGLALLGAVQAARQESAVGAQQGPINTSNNTAATATTIGYRGEGGNEYDESDLQPERDYYRRSDGYGEYSHYDHDGYDTYHKHVDSEPYQPYKPYR